ncbi:DUF2393 family protein [Helicobacter sp. 11S03491-1]|uniref:DUF2393 family protein n=1 Tax=Helicobacter sp. 11S03491-1 TaxID=1476196 RepID=UPI000BA6D790|nr:DUF2393 family protein [Helicobacter sp. 11S03491-1]PAF43062.1 hypothetical protein BKH45_03070 [Helicobacter sp. 11S03491-1]
MQEIKNSFLMVFHRLGYLELGLFLGIFIVFLIIFTLGLWFYPKKILSNFLFLLSFLTLISPPFVLQYLMQEKIYKIHISYHKVSPLVYADAFLVDVDVQNIGKATINKCLVSINVSGVKNKNWLARIKNAMYPQKVFTHLFRTKIKVNQTQHLLFMFDNYDYKNNPYTLNIDCF